MLNKQRQKIVNRPHLSATLLDDNQPLNVGFRLLCDNHHEVVAFEPAT